MLHRGFSLLSAFGRHPRLCITFLNTMSSFGAISYSELSALRVLLDAELGCRYSRMRVDIDKNVNARHECFPYIHEHVPCLAIRPAGMLEDYIS